MRMYQSAAGRRARKIREMETRLAIKSGPLPRFPLHHITIQQTFLDILSYQDTLLEVNRHKHALLLPHSALHRPLRYGNLLRPSRVKHPRFSQVDEW